MAGRERAPVREDPARRVILRAFRLAARAGTECRPIHLAMALAELDSAVGAALRPLRVDQFLESRQGGGAGSSYIFAQTQQAASEFAASRGEPRGTAHLAVAMIDQGDHELHRSLADASIDCAAVRRTALTELGASSDLAVIMMPPLTPAGTLDRPALDLDQLDPRAWRVLTWRHQRLPLSQVRRASHLAALQSSEDRAAWRVADEAGVDDDQRYSLLHHHRHAVEQGLGPIHAKVHPAHAPHTGAEKAGWTPGRRRRRAPNFVMGWPTWIGNRRVQMRNWWFRIATAHVYRGQPRVND